MKECRKYMKKNAEFNTNDINQNLNEDTPDAPQNLFQKINWHIVFILVFFIIIGLIYHRIMNYGTLVDPSTIEGNDELDVLDYFAPLLGYEGPLNEDGITTVVAFGNSPFSDDRNANDNLAKLIADTGDITVYNCSVENSFLTIAEDAFPPRSESIDNFNLYSLLTLFANRENPTVISNFNRCLDAFGSNLPEGAQEAYDTLTTIDPEIIDVITIMYDGSDYLAGHNMYSDENATDVWQFTGNLEASIELIRTAYPHIRIIVLSPTYAFAVDESGNYVSSDLYRYGQDVLSTYVIKQSASSYAHGITFVDNLYGSVHEGNATEYLIDNIHLNVDGRKLVAQRFLDALHYYDEFGQGNEEK